MLPNSKINFTRSKKGKVNATIVVNLAIRKQIAGILERTDIVELSSFLPNCTNDSVGLFKMITLGDNHNFEGR